MNGNQKYYTIIILVYPSTRCEKLRQRQTTAIAVYISSPDFIFPPMYTVHLNVWKIFQWIMFNRPREFCSSNIQIYETGDERVESLTISIVELKASTRVEMSESY